MAIIAIFYPLEFNSYTKFCRKIARILENLSEYNIVYESDERGFIKDFFSKKKLPSPLKSISFWQDSNITHAIVFDDGEVFPDLISELQSREIRHRIIKIKLTRVINIKKDVGYSDVRTADDYEYIGRGSYWGNPYSMYEAGDSRDEVMRKYKYDFDYDKFPNKEKNEVYKLAGKRLGCFCKPLSCHGDILADYLNGQDDGN